MCFISFRVSKAEKEEIERKANECGMSRSRYIKNAALGIVPKSKIDRKSIHELSKLNADMGRIGGLLKLWLTNNKDRSLHHKLEILDLVNQISKLKDIIREAILKL